jgi:hypothetical protein
MSDIIGTGAMLASTERRKALPRKAHRAAVGYGTVDQWTHGIAVGLLNDSSHVFHELDLTTIEAHV